MKSKTTEFRVTVTHPRRWRWAKVAHELTDVVNTVTEDTAITIEHVGKLTSLKEITNG